MQTASSVFACEFDLSHATSLTLLCHLRVTSTDPMLSPLALICIVIVSCLMSVAILASLLRTAVPGIGRWCVAYALLAAASVWVLLCPAPPGPLVTAGASLVTFAAVLLLVQGTRQFFGLDSVRHMESAALLIVYVALVYFTCVSPNIDAKITLLSVALAYARIAVGTLALRHAPRDGARYPYRFVAAAAYLGALVHVARIVAVAFGLGPKMALVQPSPWNVVFLGLAIVTLPCMSTGMVMLANDRLARRMEQLASVDELTGVLMRRAFMAKANALLREASAEGKPLAVAILDIDNFKAINDRFGHAAGDRVLTHIASTVSARLRPCELFGRLGGEEFAIVFANAKKADAQAWTNQLRLAVAQSPNDGVRCTFSAGVECVRGGDALADVLARADTALYTAKETGRNRVVPAPELDARDLVEPG